VLLKLENPEPFVARATKVCSPAAAVASGRNEYVLVAGS
jgi:hypothetical protein